MEYDKINEMFEPIFEWLKEHYPNGAYFLVDKYCAKLYAKENISVFSKDIQDCCKSFYEDNKNREKVVEEKRPMFILNKDILNGKR